MSIEFGPLLPSSPFQKLKPASSDLARRPQQESREQRGDTSLWSQGQRYLEQHREELLQERQDPTLGEKYGESVIRTKFDHCFANVEVCVERYDARRAAANRKRKKEGFTGRIEALLQHKRLALQEARVNKLRKQFEKTGKGLEQLRAEEVELAQRRLQPGRPPKDVQEEILLEEVAQEFALTKLDERIEAGTVKPESLNAAILLELGLADANHDQRIEHLEQGWELIRAELNSFVERGLINRSEAEIIRTYSRSYAQAFQQGLFKFHGEQTTQHLFELTRDNMRKVTYQTVIDRKTLAGSDHGVRHIYQGNTHFAEKMIQGLSKNDKVDFKSRDEVLIRQIIIDHDLGYTTPAALTKEGGGAAKDHPCIGCRYIEANQSYYREKFGQDGYDVARDVLLNHSYPSSRYTEKRPETTSDRPITYNRHLIRSVVSTVDGLGVTAETKAMELFRYPTTIAILQETKNYLDREGDQVNPEAVRGFCDRLKQAVDDLVSQGRISALRGQAFHQAIDQKFDARIIKKTLGQYTGIVTNVALEKSGETFKPTIQLDLSELQALVADLFGEKTALESFKKVMETFGLSEEDWKKLAKTVRELRTETDEKKREKLIKKLTIVTERAQFRIGLRESTGLADEREDEYQAILAQFAAFKRQAS